MLLEGKKAVITGGSRGIGRAIARSYLRHGAAVSIISRSEIGDLTELHKLASDNGIKVKTYLSDVTDESEISSTVNEIITAEGKIDILVNNAGITRDGILFAMKKENWSTVLETNLYSIFYTCKILARHMATKKAGSIINMSSIVGITGNGGQSNYAASKSGIIGFTKSLAQEIGSRSVRVNAIAPGFIVTDMTDRLTAEQKINIEQRIPLKRLGQVEDIADTALFLGSDMSKYITGQVLSIDGGMHM